MRTKELRHIARLEKMLSKRPLQCKKINFSVAVYIQDYGDNDYIQGFSRRYEELLQRDMKYGF